MPIEKYPLESVKMDPEYKRRILLCTIREDTLHIYSILQQ
jgi:hypothetical protein